MLRSRTLFATFAPALALNFAFAQEPTPQGPPPGATVLTTSTQLVQVDVIVTDASGNIVHDLKASDFRVDEDKKPQTIRNFEETLAVAPANLANVPKVNLTPGTFTDFSPVPDKSPLTVLLLDRLNTETADQTTVKQQLRAFLHSAPPNSRIAIFGLNSRLVMLQGFTSDPEFLRAAIDKKGFQPSILLPTPGDTSLAADAAESGAPDAAELAQFEAEAASYQTQNRIRLTLTAFDQLAAYLGSFSGRKNVIWFSGSFPLSIDFDPNIQYGFNTEANFTDQFHKTVNLLARARVAIYPVEAGGLKTDPTMSFAVQGPATLKTQLSGSNTWQSSQNYAHNTMNQLANDTGGRAYYNNNDLVGAVRDSIANGSQYYTLTYTPTNKDTRDGFRSIRVDLTGAAAARGMKLSYRRGYYTLGNKPTKTLSAKKDDAAPAPDPAVQAALQHGAPAPSEILFKVRVLPAAPGAKVPSGPGSAYTVDFSALANRIDMPVQADGRHHGAVEFAVFIFDGEGKQLGNPAVRPVTLNVPQAGYATAVRGGIAVSETVLAPPHAATFRLAVHDLTSGRLGVVEIPLASVRNLAPAAPGS